MSHLKEADRRKIYSMLAHGNKCCEIAEAVGCDPTAIAKEIKRNRIVSKDASKGQSKILCKKLDKWPYVCGTCKHKYTDCCFLQLKYDPMLAQKKYEAKLHNSRKGINLTKEEYDRLVSTIKVGLAIKRSVYASVIASKVDISLPTVYRYISEKRVPISKMDLPYAVTYKNEEGKIKRVRLLRQQDRQEQPYLFGLSSLYEEPYQRNHGSDGFPRLDKVRQQIYSSPNPPAYTLHSPVHNREEEFDQGGGRVRGFGEIAWL